MASLGMSLAVLTVPAPDLDLPFPRHKSSILVVLLLAFTQRVVVVLTTTACAAGFVCEDGVVALKVAPRVVSTSIL